MVSVLVSVVVLVEGGGNTKRDGCAPGRPETRRHVRFGDRARSSFTRHFVIGTGLTLHQVCSLHADKHQAQHGLYSCLTRAEQRWTPLK